MWQPAVAASLLLLGQVSASVLGNGAMLVRKDGVEQQMRRYVDAIVEPIERRATMAMPNTTQWNGLTMAACTSALETLQGNADNPSGMAACYNLPYLDNSTGVFQADLRLFTISAPTGAFASIPSQDVMVGLSYVGATVSAVNASALMRRGDARVSLISWPRNVDGKKRQAAVPVMAQQYTFVGQINKDLMTPNMDSTTMEKLITPTITLTGKEASGQTVNTTLTASEALFVSGVFAKAATTPTKAAVQAPIQTLVVASNAPFILPGQNILIFPIGGVITGVWAVLFLATWGYGTFGRIQWRDQYRRRSALRTKGDFARI